MSARQIPGLELWAEWEYGESGWKAGMDENMFRLSYMTHLTIQGFVSALPENPTNGHCFIITEGDYEDHVLIRDLDTWYYMNPFAGLKCFSIEDDCHFVYRGEDEYSSYPLTWHPQDNSETIKILYELNENTNAYTDAEKDKLANIPANAAPAATAVQIKSLYESNANTNEFTDEEKAKLNAIQLSRFLGIYATLTSLINAHPEPLSGSYAYVDLGAGIDIRAYIWDPTDNIYIPMSGGSGGDETPESVKTKYEANDNTNAFTDDEKTKLDGIEEGATNTPPLPSLTGNAGRVLGANNQENGVEWIELPDIIDPEDELPVTTNQEGRFLFVDQSGDPAWTDLPDPPEAELPDTTNQEGKFLTVNNVDAPVWGDLPDPPEDRLPVTITEDAEKVVAVNAIGDGYELVNLDLSFTAMPDTPSAYTGSANSFLRVNGSEDAVEFVTPLLTMLGGFPASYTGHSGKMVIVNGLEDGLEFDDIPSGLPAIGGGDANKILRVNGSSDGVLWDPETEELPALTGHANKVLKVNGTADGILWDDAASALPDLTANAGKFLRVNSTSDDVEWDDPESQAEALTVEVLGSSPVTLTEAGRNKLLESTSGSAFVVSLPLNSSEAIEVGSLFTITQIGTGVVTVEAVAGVTLNGVDGDAYDFMNRYGSATLYKRATNEWVISGAVEVVE